MLGHDSVDIFKKICLALIWSFGEGTRVAAGRLGRGSAVPQARGGIVVMPFGLFVSFVFFSLDQIF